MSQPSSTNCSIAFLWKKISDVFSPNMFFSLIAFGGYSSGDHLFPFRTEKLSPLAQMVLPYKVEEYVAASFTETPSEMTGFRFLWPQRCGEKIATRRNYKHSQHRWKSYRRKHHQCSLPT